MDKLTLENIAPYLPYKLAVEHIDTDCNVNETTIDFVDMANTEMLTFMKGADFYFTNSDIKVKPILRPMDLTKPIIVEGKEIIPIVELAKIAFPNEKTWTIESEEEGIISCMDFDFGYRGNSFKSSGYMYKPVHVPSQLILFQWLLKHKFDVFGLIEKGLAIDANTLTTNPYD